LGRTLQNMSHKYQPCQLVRLTRPGFSDNRALVPFLARRKV
jgi:hypothetical protein